MGHDTRIPENEFFPSAVLVFDEWQLSYRLRYTLLLFLLLVLLLLLSVI